MSIGIKRTQRDNTHAFKLAAVEQVERGELTYLTAQHRYRIQGRSTVLTWLRKQGHPAWYNLSSSDLKVTAMTKKAFKCALEEGKAVRLYQHSAIKRYNSKGDIPVKRNVS